MRKEWKRSKGTIAGLPCIQHIYTGEFALVGKYGEIWEYSETEFSAVITNHRLANRLCRQFGRKAHYRAGDEALFRFPNNQAKAFLDTIKPFKYQKYQIDRANAFGSPSKSNIGALESKTTAVFAQNATDLESAMPGAHAVHTVGLKVEYEGISTVTDSQQSSIVQNRRKR